MVNLYQGDCLEEMGKVADHSVDMIFTDLPYKENENKNIISCILGMRCHRMVG